MADFDSLDSLNKELERLQAQRLQLFERERLVAIQRLRSVIDLYVIQPQELGFAGLPGQPVAARSTRLVAKRYVDPVTGKSWGGRGARPAWLREALQAGGRLDDFLAVSVLPVAAPLAAAAHGARTPAPASATRPPALYRDPVSQQTWSGRGAHPTWLRKAIEAGHHKEDFRVDAVEAAGVTPVPSRPSLTLVPGLDRRPPGAAASWPPGAAAAWPPSRHSPAADGAPVAAAAPVASVARGRRAPLPAGAPVPSSRTGPGAKRRGTTAPSNRS